MASDLTTCPHHGVLCNDHGTCPQCGWRPPRRPSRPGTTDGRQAHGACQFEHNGRRCPFPGNIDRQWCLHHSSDEHRDHDARQDHFFAQSRTREQVNEVLWKWYGKLIPESLWKT